MGKAWYDASAAAREIFARADEAMGDSLGAPLSTLCFEGPADTLNRTDVSQPAIFATGLACWAGLRERGMPMPAATAGLSLGEYTALVVAGAIGFEDGLRLVALRGQAMQEAAESVPSGMVALIGADEASATALCEQAAEGETLVVANLNAPGQVVISGTKAACERAEAAAGSHNLRATPLGVAGAFHSPIMAPAAARLRAALEQTPIKAPVCACYSNVTAGMHEAGGSGSIEQSIRDRLFEQLTNPVRWAESMVAASERFPVPGVQWIELAPGRALTGMMRRIARQTKVESYDTPPDAPSPSE